METPYQYKVEDNCIVVTNTETNKPTVLTNFTAKITKEEKFVDNNGKPKVYVHIEGISQDGMQLSPVRLSMNEFDGSSWFRDCWGSKVNLHRINGKNAPNLSDAIRSISEDTMRYETVYSHTGLVFQQDKPMFLFGNGAITVNGIDSSYRTNLPNQLKFYKLSDKTNNSDIKTAINEVISLLDFSEKNPYIGTLLCMAAFRAVISMWIPIDLNFFLVGEKRTYKSSIAKIIHGFFGSINNSDVLIPWKSTSVALENLAKVAKNGVVAVDDFVYPSDSNRLSEQTQKVDDLLRTTYNRSTKTRSENHGSGIEDNTELNCLVISTGELPPYKALESLHERGIYVPFEQGDIKLEKLKTLQVLTKDGVLAQVNTAFIQYLLSDYENNARLAEEFKEKYLEQLEASFPDNARIMSQVAGLLVAWRFFCKFAVKNKSIDKGKSLKLRKIVKARLIDLMRKQQSIYSISPSALFIKGLKRAFKEGEVHIVDSATGRQPKDFDSAQVGWQNNKPNGMRIGCLQVETGDFFISSKLKVRELINLLPEGDRQHFSTNPKKFWIDLKNQGLLDCPEEGRNTRRKTFSGVQAKEHYHLKMPFLKKTVSGDTTTKKPSKTGKTGVNQKTSNAKMSSSASKTKPKN
jgi:hypothetical protein